MATVFAARQTGPLGLGRLVALKVMSTALLGDESLERLFIREAGISARLQHDNIVRVYEVDEADATYFIAMELVVGTTLRDLDGTPPPPLPVTLAIVHQIAEALDYAHNLRAPTGEPLGIVHQDVTPHNIMVTYGGVVKLLDFGVARIGQLDASRTETIRGKPAYLAPEQLTGQRIDRRTDVFALGIVMHELLSGDRLFRASNDVTTYHAVLEKAVPDLPNVPAPIARVCLDALRRDPADRFESAAELARALREAARRANTNRATREELATWVAAACPPEWTLEELERETLAEETRVRRIETVQDLPTRSAPSPNPAPDEPAVSRPSRLGMALLGAAALSLGAAASLAVNLRATKRAEAVFPAVTLAEAVTVVAPVAPPSPAETAPADATTTPPASSAAAPRPTTRPRPSPRPVPASPPKAVPSMPKPLPTTEPHDHGIPTERD